MSGWQHGVEHNLPDYKRTVTRDHSVFYLKDITGVASFAVQCLLWKPCGYLLPCQGMQFDHTYAKLYIYVHACIP